MGRSAEQRNTSQPGKAISRAAGGFGRHTGRTGALVCKRIDDAGSRGTSVFLVITNHIERALIIDASNLYRIYLSSSLSREQIDDLMCETKQ